MSQLKAEHINPFLDAARETFSIMTGLELTRKSLSLKKAGDTNSDISGIIGLAGEVSGSVVLNFPFATASGVVSKFLDMEITDPHDYEVLDAIGELTNIIAGRAKSLISENGLRFQIGLPTIVIGPSHYVGRPRNIPTVCVRWTCDKGEFALEVCLKLDADAGDDNGDNESAADL